MLASVATRMASTLRGADTIGRMGGDEFVVLIDGSEPMVAPELVAERLLDVMRQPFEFDGCSTSLHRQLPALGSPWAIAPAAANCSVTRILRSTRPKPRGRIATSSSILRCRPISVVESGSNSICDRRWLATQFRLVYQPIYNLDDLTVVGVEALLRWEHPADGLLCPDEFIPILEQSGQIREVGAWVMHQACAQMAAWHARGYHLKVSVNVSGRQLDDDRIVEHIRHALEREWAVGRRL